MIHYGDITKLSGYELPIVDVITGGSPCQDLSIAGKREGLAGERSGLFMEQIRIVKEMREHDRANGRTGYAVRPRYMVFENVKGVFSSNKRRDFQAVLTEIVRIAEPSAPDVPMPENGRWPHAGCLYSDVGGWSVAWRLHDAQFWGVPQRRERICVVADFGGLSAPEILFERKGLSGDIEPCGETREGAAGAVAESVGTSGGDIVPSVFSVDCRNGTESEVNGALQADSCKSLNSNNVCRCGDVVRRLTPLECERLQGFPDNWTLIGEPAGFESWTDERGREYPVQVYKTVNPITGKPMKVSDTARYRALGNSIALPFWFYVLRRISAQYERPATLGSLFDGIGGFPLCWERCNGKGTAIWASEIEPFCIAVTMERFGGNPAQKSCNAV